MSEVDLGYDDLDDTLEDIAVQMDEDGFSPDHVIGISRGGLIPAVDLSHRFRADMGIVDASHYNQEEMVEFEIKDSILDGIAGDVLIVDDIADTGRTLKEVVRYVEEQCDTTETRTATIHYKPRSIVEPDYYHEEAEGWTVYDWVTSDERAQP